MTTDELLTLLNDEATPSQKMEVVKSLTVQRLKVLLNVDEVPQKFEYIVDEVSLRRFNRLGFEGVKSFKQEGLSEDFQDSDFDEFMKEITDFRESNDKDYLDYWTVYKA